jgi:hypothetical protein
MPNFLESGRDGDAVKHRVHRYAGEQLLLSQRDAQFFVGTPNFRIEFVQTVQSGLLFGRRVVNDVLVINLGILDVCPGWLALRPLERHPMTIRLEPPLQHKLRLLLLR